MSVLFSIVIAKRLFFEQKSDVSKLAFHLVIIAAFMALLRIHRTCDLATRVVPLLIGGLSYYGHTHYLILAKTIKMHSSLTSNQSPAGFDSPI
jgi:hypothetical protein